MKAPIDNYINPIFWLCLFWPLKTLEPFRERLDNNHGEIRNTQSGTFEDKKSLVWIIEVVDYVWYFWEHLKKHILEPVWFSMQGPLT
jgi:hypothetical protein